MTDVLMRVVLQGSDQGLTSTVKNVANVIKGDLGGGGGASGVVAGLSIAVVGLGIGLVKMAGDYNQAMMELQNTTGSTDAQMKGYTSSIRQISDATGVYQENLAKGMYQVISANFAGADATNILNIATKDAVETGADQTQVTTGLVVSLNAWNQKASQATTVSNQMFETLALGRGSMNDLAGALQTGGALVAHYGLNITNTDAILATLSTGGMKTFGVSMTGLTQLLNVMDGKTDLITKRIHKLGLSFDETKFKTMNTVQQIDYLNQVMAKNQGQEVSVFGSKQAVSVLSILGTHSDLLTTNIKKLSDTQGLAKQQTDAWTRTQHDFNFELQDAETRAKNLGISSGLMLLPALSNLMDFIRNPLMPWVDNLIVGVQNVTHWFGSAGPQGDILKVALVGVGLAIGTIKVIELSQNFMNFATKTIPETISKIGDLVGTAGLKQINGAAKSASDAEIGIGTTAKTTMATDVEEGSTAAKLSIAEIGVQANETEGTVKTASTGMGTAIGGVMTGLLGILGIQAVIDSWNGLNNLTVDAKKPGNETKVVQDINQMQNPGNLEQKLADWIDSWFKNNTSNSTGTGDLPQKNPGPNTPFPTKPGAVGRHFASGGIIPPRQYGIVNDGTGRNAGPELMYGGTSGISVLDATRTRSALSGHSRGGHVANTFNITINSQATVTSQLVDEIEREIAHRFRAQTGGFDQGNYN